MCSLNNNQTEERICAELKNPFDALQILAKAAINDIDSSDHNHFSPSSNIPSSDTVGNWHSMADSIRHSDQNSDFARGIKDYELVRNGALEVETILKLLRQ